MSYLDKYVGKRRVIKRALKLHDKHKKLSHELNIIEDDIKLCESQMTGGDSGVYALVMEQLNTLDKDKRPTCR
jgi:hypothetical protein